MNCEMDKSNSKQLTVQYVQLPSYDTVCYKATVQSF